MRYVDRRKGVLWPMSSCQGIKGLSEECKPREHQQQNNKLGEFVAATGVARRIRITSARPFSSYWEVRNMLVYFHRDNITQ